MVVFGASSIYCICTLNVHICVYAYMHEYIERGEEEEGGRERSLHMKRKFLK